MTEKEKLTKVRAELERVMEWEKEQAAHTYGNLCQLHECKADMCDKFLSFIDSMQKEPKECMYSKDNYTDEDRKTLCDGCEEECKFNKKEEPINDSFEAEVKKLWEEINTGHSYSIVDSYNQFYGLCMEIAEWQKQKDSIPVSEDLEKVSFDNAQKNYKEGFRGTAMQAFNEGANWQKQKMMAKAVDGFVIEDIEEGNGDFLLSAEYLSKDMGLKDRQKVKVIVIKDN